MKSKYCLTELVQERIKMNSFVKW